MEKLSESGQKIVNATKERTKEVLAMVSLPILVGSKDGAEEAGRLRGQIGAVGDAGKIKP